MSYSTTDIMRLGPGARAQIFRALSGSGEETPVKAREPPVQRTDAPGVSVYPEHAERRQNAAQGATVARFVVPGVPVGKGRPRFTRQGRAYTPKKTREYEALIRRCWQEQSGVRFPDGVPVVICFTAYFPEPKGWSKRKRAEMDGSLRVGKPDTDNILKALEDALNGAAYADDSAVMIGKCVKRYTSEEPCVSVRLYSYE